MFTPKLFKNPPESKIQIDMMSIPKDASEVVKNIANIEGCVDMYCWYSGAYGLPKDGAETMSSSIFSPLYRKKQDIMLNLYSLRAWQFDDKDKVSRLGKAIEQLNNPAVQWLESSTFFRFCLDKADGELYELIKAELPKKQWLFELSERRTSKKGLKNKSVREFLGNNKSLLDCLNDYDVQLAYSSMQYVEGYYLIRRSVQNAINKKSKQVQIAFVLANDESDYYQDLQKDIEKMLKADFGRAIEDFTIKILFQLFKYGEPDCRPYNGTGVKLKPSEMGGIFKYLDEDNNETMRLIQSGKICPDKSIAQIYINNQTGGIQ